ncbi:putative dehydrogenase [Filimonas zeae]|nr:Gfo/Idh/MocA family oxidoreductase [Filimonas zeae]MDR6340773.1 putative dehydrogenase [Filimonas zeae]
MKKFAWGIIGPGGIASQFVADFQWINTHHCFVKAIYSHRKESAEEFAGKHAGAEVFTDIDAFVTHSGVQAVYIATPHSYHYKYAAICLKHKIPVLCEKPLTISYPQTQELIHLAQQYQTLLMEGMWVRYLPSFSKLIHLVEEGDIGDVISIKASMSYRAPKDENSRYYNPELGGGALLDLGIYTLFLSVLFMGRPDQVHASARKSAKGIDEHSVVLLSKKQQQYALLESSILVKTKNDAVISGCKGTITIHEPWNEKPKGISIEWNDGSTADIPCEWPGSGFQYETEAFLQTWESGQAECDRMPYQTSLLLAELADIIKNQIGVAYPAEGKV